MAALMNSVAARALKLSSAVNFRLNQCGGSTAHRVRSLSTVMSPPSKAIVYEQHGSPDSVTRFVVYCVGTVSICMYTAHI